MAAGASFAQDLPDADSVTVALPAVAAGEYNGDLARVPLLPRSVGAPYFQRKRMPGPPRGNVEPDATMPPSAAAFGPSAPMPGPLANFLAMRKTDACNGGSCGDGWPPDPNSDVGPNHIVLTVNSSVAIYDKAGTRLAAFTENTLWSGVGKTPCNGNSQGDPIALYDWLADRFVITWFAFGFSSTGLIGPYYQCIAASKTGDPVAGGWWLYAVRMDTGATGAPPVNTLQDYGKFGLWHDCLYMTANGFLNGDSFNGVLYASFSRADLYSGAPLTASIGFLRYPANAVFGMLPSHNNGRGTNAAQPGAPNFLVMESFSNKAFEVRRFTAGPNCGAGGTLSTATLVPHTAITFQQGSIVPQPGTTNRLDMIDDRLMQKAQYRRINGAESVWVTHSVKNPSGTNTATQWAQINVTGGTVSPTLVQQQVFSPDNALYRFMSSLAVDRQGNMALGYSTSSGAVPNYPGIAYAGRLAIDPPGTLPWTEVRLVAGGGSQDNTCGGSPCDRWGDYSSMSVDPADDCTFWYTNEYYDTQANGNAGNWNIRIGSFRFPTCTASAPTAATGIATGVAPTAATLNGVMSSNGAGTTVTFQFGPTTAYGDTVAGTPSPLLASDAGVTVSGNVSGLLCDTVYHFRVVGTNSAGSAGGADATFRTGSCAGVPILTVALLGNGGGLVVSGNAPGIDCGKQCAALFAPGTQVLLQGTAFPGSLFAGWTGPCAGTAPCTLAVTGPVTLVATFAYTGTAFSFDYVQKAYVACYGRPADPPGQAYWAGQMDLAGGSIAAIIDAFGNSPEFVQRFGGLTNTQLVTGIYQRTLARNPDAAGLAYYVGELEAGRMTLQTIALDVINGATGGGDAVVVANKLNVAAYYTGKVAAGCGYGTAAEAATLLLAVNGTSASVAAARSAVDARCGP